MGDSHEAEGAGRDCRGVAAQCELVAAQESASLGMDPFLPNFLFILGFGVVLLWISGLIRLVALFRCSGLLFDFGSRCKSRSL